MRGAATGSVGGRPPRREPRSRPERSGAVRPSGVAACRRTRSRWRTLESTSHAGSGRDPRAPRRVSHSSRRRAPVAVHDWSYFPAGRHVDFQAMPDTPLQPPAGGGAGGQLTPPPQPEGMHEYVGALDQGTTSTRFMIFNHSGGVVGDRPEGARADLPEAGLGRARRRWRSGRAAKR